jgi:hypothetical protein
MSLFVAPSPLLLQVASITGRPIYRLQPLTLPETSKKQVHHPIWLLFANASLFSPAFCPPWLFFQAL